LEETPTPPAPWFSNILSNMMNTQKHYNRLVNNEKNVYQRQKSHMEPEVDSQLSHQHTVKLNTRAHDNKDIKEGLDVKLMAQAMFNTLVDNSRAQDTQDQKKK